MAASCLLFGRTVPLLPVAPTNPTPPPPLALQPSLTSMTSSSSTRWSAAWATSAAWSRCCRVGAAGGGGGPCPLGPGGRGALCKAALRGSTHSGLPCQAPARRHSAPRGRQPAHKCLHPLPPRALHRPPSPSTPNSPPTITSTLHPPHPRTPHPPPPTGMNQIQEKQIQEVERRYAVFESMINSMTKKEREQPELLAKSPSRRWAPPLCSHTHTHTHNPPPSLFGVTPWPAATPGNLARHAQHLGGGAWKAAGCGVGQRFWPGMARAPLQGGRCLGGSRVNQGACTGRQQRGVLGWQAA